MNEVFKVTVMWSAWTEQIATRILRDVLDLQRLAQTNRATLVVATDELLAVKLRAIGVTTSSNFSEPSYTRVYLDEGYVLPDDVSDRIQEDSRVDIISLKGEALPESKLVVDKDPYAGVQFYKSWRPIPETLSLNQRAPKQNGEPMFSPLV